MQWCEGPGGIQQEVAALGQCLAMWTLHSMELGQERFSSLYSRCGGGLSLSIGLTLLSKGESQRVLKLVRKYVRLYPNQSEQQIHQTGLNVGRKARALWTDGCGFQESGVDTTFFGVEHFGACMRLHSNHLYCDCHLAWLSDWLRQRRTVGQFTLCMAPVHLRGFNVADVQKKEYVCPESTFLSKKQQDIAHPVAVRIQNHGRKVDPPTSRQSECLTHSPLERLGPADRFIVTWEHLDQFLFIGINPTACDGPEMGGKGEELSSSTDYAPHATTNSASPAPVPAPQGI
ncbi:hypothetical protein P7K49_003841 [Saguinus oedipus]|uniref:LRRCT domain-containing protein n=1 Tax=Saguinus oedipus TaxID=9490 RepID=A0ABQ9W6D9_SAGOE|nr:hypothetical protein P7K49_003841 [Saguinus oedipus]